MSQDQGIYVQAKCLLPEICAMRHMAKCSKSDWILQLLRQQNAPMHFSNSCSKKKVVYVAQLAPGKELANFIKTTIPPSVRHSHISEILMDRVGGSASLSQWNRICLPEEIFYAVHLKSQTPILRPGPLRPWQRDYIEVMQKALSEHEFKGEQTG